MHIHVREEGDISILTFSESRLEARITDEFVEEMKRLFKQGKTLFVLNIADVEFIDSCYLGALLGISRTSKSEGRTIMISNVQEYIQKLFRIIRIENAFQVCETEEEAIRILLSS